MFRCALCQSSETDEDIYGEVLDNGIQVHTFCLYLTPNLCQAGDEDEGLLGFLLDDIIKEARRISKLHCCYCSKSYANIGCCNTKCRRCFHLICGINNGAENQFADTYNSYCNRHVSKKSCPAPKHVEKCCICYEYLRKPRQTFNAVNMLRAPCCKNGWFHKMCLQKFAKTAGYFFKCPLCNDNKIFCKMLPYRGIFVYDRDAAWELEPNAFADQLERPNSCAANVCQCMDGRKKTTTKNPLLLCSGCGSIAMHKQCLPALIKGNNFYCIDCNIGQESKCKSLLLMQISENNNEDDDVDVCNDSDENFALDTSRTSISLSSSSEEIIFRGNTVQRINRVYDHDDDDDDDDEYTECLNSQCIPRQNALTKKVLLDESDLDKQSRVQLINLTDKNHENEDDENVMEACTDDNDMPQSSRSSVDENVDCIPIQRSSTVSKRRKIFDKTICISDDSNCSLYDFHNSKPLDLKADKLYDNKPISSIAIVEPSKKPLLNITNDVGPCNSSWMNQSCIANCTSRKSIHKDSDSALLPKSHTFATAENVTNDVSASNLISMNTSCIANRTRRKSIYKDTSAAVKTSENSHTPTTGQEDFMLTTSCVAQRTRRKSICYQRQLSNETSEGYGTNMKYESLLSESKSSRDFSIARRLRKRQAITRTAVDVKKVEIPALTSSSDVSSDTQFESFSTTSSTTLTSMSTKSSYKSIESSTSQNEASTSAESSNSNTNKNRVKVLVKRVHSSSTSRGLNSLKYTSLLSTDNDNYLKAKRIASETRAQRNFRLEIAKCPMRAKHNNIIPYLASSFRHSDGSLKKDSPCKVVELYD